MAVRDRPTDRAARLAARSLAAIGAEIRRARTSAGLSQAAVGRAAGVCHSTVSRIERGRLQGVSIDVLCRTCAAVGLDLVVRAYPDADPVRDAAHVGLLERLRRRLPAETRWRTEVPLPIPGDRRAWDAIIDHGGTVTAVEAETRLADLQAVERRIALKGRDGGSTRMVILVADTAANRAALAVGREALRHDYPLDTREVMAALAAGRQPGANGIVIL
jgi:transcriptional regulator with XRE-family HTH domain